MRNMLIALCFISLPVVAQDACIQDGKPHYFVATGTVKTTMTAPLKDLLTDAEELVWTNTFRTFGVTSPAHKDLAACDNALDMLRAQRNLPAKQPIHAIQSLSYEGFCLPVEVCP